MSFTWDDQLSPRPDTHGIPSFPLDSTNLVLPYGEQHGRFVYPIDSTGDVLPKADNHDNTGFAMHPGTPKPGSFKDQQTPGPAGSYHPTSSGGATNADPRSQ